MVRAASRVRELQEPRRAAVKRGFFSSYAPLQRFLVLLGINGVYSRNADAARVAWVLIPTKARASG